MYVCVLIVLCVCAVCVLIVFCVCVVCVRVCVLCVFCVCSSSSDMKYFLCELAPPP